MRYPVYNIDSFSRLNNITKQLYLCGDRNLLENNASIAIVGTRKPQTAAQEIAFQLGKAAAEADVLVVSGLALGIDTYAHRGALAGKGKTGAFLGSGLANVSPKSNQGLAANILAAGGFVASEVSDRQSPAKANQLIARNRLISGLADMVVIIESGVNGGTMHTARFAFKQGKPLYCPTIKSPGVDILSQHPACQLTAASKAFHGVSIEQTEPLARLFDDCQQLIAENF